MTDWSLSMDQASAAESLFEANCKSITSPALPRLSAWLKARYPFLQAKDIPEVGIFTSIFAIGSQSLIVAQFKIFSNLFPEVDTTTRGQVWIFDRNGAEIATLDFDLPSHGMHQVRISNLIDREYGYGTFMWHIRIPDSIAKLEVVRKNLIYFTDRGYICYEKDHAQPAFVHGVDRYAVFQEQSMQVASFYDPQIRMELTQKCPIQAGMQ